jgi:hypothetical protein
MQDAATVASRQQADAQQADAQQADAQQADAQQGNAQQADAGLALGEGAGYDLIARTLLACEVERLSGVLRVTGEPGGLIHLTDGNITAVETPGAPGPDLILVRSGRIPEASWAAAFTAAAAGGRMGSELVKRGLIGEGELEAVLRIALADAMFAVAGGRVDEAAVEHATTPSLLPLEQPAAPGWLLFETSRRLQVLASTAGLVRHDKDRVTADPTAPLARGGALPPGGGALPPGGGVLPPGGGALPPGGGVLPPGGRALPPRGGVLPPGGRALPPGQDEIIALANGRRTARDMAFILGRGVYSLSLELSKMNANGLVSITSRRSIGPAKHARQQVPQSAEAPDGDDQRAAPANDLPRRHQPGRQPRSAPAEIMPPPSSALLRLLRLFPSGDRDSSGSADAGAEM